MVKKKETEEFRLVDFSQGAEKKAEESEEQYLHRIEQMYNVTMDQFARTEVDETANRKLQEIRDSPCASVVEEVAACFVEWYKFDSVNLEDCTDARSRAQKCLQENGIV